MTALRRRVGRTLRAEWRRYLGALVIIGLSAMALTLMTHFQLNFERHLLAFEHDAAQEHASFRVTRPLDDLDRLEAESRATIERTGVLDVAIDGGRTLRLLGRTRQVDVPVVLDGRELRDPGEVLLHKAFATQQGLSVGDTVTTGERSLSIVGIVALPSYIYPIASEVELMPSPGFGVGVVAPVDLASLGEPDLRYAVRFASPVDPRGQARALKQRLDARGAHVTEWTNIDDNKRVNIAHAEARILGLVATGVPAALLLLACVTVATLLQRTIAAESAVIGALSALGLRRSEIAAHYLTYPLVLGAGGGALGTLLGAAPVRPYVDFFTSVFVVPAPSLLWSPGWLLASLIAPAIFLCATSALVLWRVLSRPTTELMRGRREGTRVSGLERALSLQRLGFRTRFQIREQVRSPARTLLLLCGVAVATVLVQWGLSLQTSMAFLTSGAADVYDFTYEYAFGEPRTDPLPDGAEPFAAARFVSADDETRDLYLTGVLPDTRKVVLGDASGALAAGGVVVTRSLARSLRVDEGGTIDVIGKLDGRELSLTVDAVAETWAGNLAFLPLDRFDALLDRPPGSYDGAFSDVALELPAGTRFSVTSLDDKLAGAQELLGLVGAFTAMLTVAAFGIGVLVVALATSLLVDENRHTIALMKVLGYPRREIDRLLLGGSVWTVALGYALGIPLTLAALGVLVGSLERSVGLVVPPPSIRPLFVAVGFVVLLAAYLVAKRASRRRIDAIGLQEALNRE